jgi:hypothetical protein
MYVCIVLYCIVLYCIVFYRIPKRAIRYNSVFDGEIRKIVHCVTTRYDVKDDVTPTSIATKTKQNRNKCLKNALFHICILIRIKQFNLARLGMR